MGEIPRYTAREQWFHLIHSAVEASGCKAQQVKEAFDLVGEDVSYDRAKDHFSRTVPGNFGRFYALLRAVRLPATEFEAAKQIWTAIQCGKLDLPEAKSLCNDDTLEKWIRRLEAHWEFGNVNAALEIARYLADNAPEKSVHHVNATRYCSELLVLNGYHSEGASMLDRYATLAKNWGPKEQAESCWLLAIHSPRFGIRVKMKLFALAESIANSQSQAIWASRLMQTIPRDRLAGVMREASNIEAIEQADARLRSAIRSSDTAQSAALGYEMLARSSLKLGKFDDAFDEIRKTYEFEGEHSLLFRVKRMITEARILSASGSNAEALLTEAEDLAIHNGFRLYARQIYKIRNASSM